MKNISRELNLIAHVTDEEIHTYEDMALYQQPENKKHPISLIGPPKFGRTELRQRLIDNDRDRFSVIVSRELRCFSFVFYFV